MKLSIEAFKRMYGASGEIRYEFSDGETLVGVASVSATEDSYFLHILTVMPEERQKGYGSLMLEAICSKFNDKPLRLELDGSSPLGLEKLRSWYERHGFTFEGGEQMVRHNSPMDEDEDV